MHMLKLPKKTAPKPYQLQPEVLNRSCELTPNEVAISMGWIEIEKRVSEMANATMKMWVDLNLRLRRHMTITTKMLATADMRTAKRFFHHLSSFYSLNESLSYQ